MRVEGIKLDFRDVLIRPKRSTLSSRKDVDLTRTFTFLHSRRTWTGVPIIAANMDSSGTFEMAQALAPHQMITALHKFYSVDDLEEFFDEFNEPEYVAYTLGIRDEDDNKLTEVLRRGLGTQFNFIVLDVPNAYLERFVVKLQELRELCPKHTIIAGNVVTNEMAEELILKGADVVKIGIGSGSACITRSKSGVGYPQLSAIIECADAAHGISHEQKGYGLITSDGGIEVPGDIAKAFCAGADFVMMGGLFAGYDQSGGKLVNRDGKQYKEFYGMSSAKAMKKYYGTIANHRASEGRQMIIPYKGDVNELVYEILGSLRSAGTYIGARRLKEFSRRATFIQVNKQVNTSLSRFDEE
jgi:GMP reductase